MNVPALDHRCRLDGWSTVQRTVERPRTKAIWPLPYTSSTVSSKVVMVVTGTGREPVGANRVDACRRRATVVWHDDRVRRERGEHAVAVVL